MTSATFTVITPDHVFVYVRGHLVLKTHRRKDEAPWLFQTAPKQAIKLAKTYATAHVTVNGALLTEAESIRF